MNELLALENVAQTEFLPTIFSFSLCILMSFLLRSFYIRRSFSLTGKNHIGSILPILSTVVFLVIIVVKSSLALSLGLVGALSIVRFRTPIKEPEELVYLFLAIAIGLGYAAGQVLITTILVLTILLMIFLFLSNKSSNQTLEYNLVINWNKESISLENLLKEFEHLVGSIKLIRLDSSGSANTVSLMVEPKDQAFIQIITDKLETLDKNSSISFFESRTNW
ncbi:DUF4956 domain-containing protein [Gammaproteobacteria bacterium]|jgi:hypothetical protein|nr:DUF4956 domain-containing protein [Gammaproteobacteria bacterium]